MEAVPHAIEARLRDRVVPVMKERLRAVAGAMLAFLVPPLVYALFVQPQPVAAALTALAQLAALVAFVLRERISPSYAVPYLALLNACAMAAAAAFYDAFDQLGYLQIGMLMLFGYAAVQLETRWVGLSFALASAFFLGVAHRNGSLGGLEIMTLTGGLGMSALLHVANRRFTERTEQKRLEAQENAQALEIALEAARHQIKERERAEEERELLRERLVESHRMEAIGTLAGGFAHEMNNLLGSVMGLANLLRHDTSGDARADAEEILAATKRGAELTRNLLMLSQDRPTRREAIDLDTVVSHVTTVLGRTLPKRIRVDIDLEGNLLLEADGARLEQALLNLCLNAVEAIPGEGVLSVAAREIALDEAGAERLRLSPGPYVTLEVADTGVGMEAATVRRMFEPFFTTKERGSGSGLGLAMVYGTVAAHEGVLDVTSAPGKGTRIVAYLPGAPALLRAVADEEARPRRASVAVLVVDDEPLLRTTTRRILEREGFEVLLAEGGAEALAIFEGRSDLVVLLDLAMPGMDGMECFRRLRALDPQARVVLTSGYAFQNDVSLCLSEGAHAFLEKPYEAGALVDALFAAAGAPATSPHSSFVRSRAQHQRAN